MKLGFISSGALHLLVVLIVWLGLPHIKRDPPKLDELIFVKLADVAKVTNPTRYGHSAKKKSKTKSPNTKQSANRKGLHPENKKPQLLEIKLFLYLRRSRVYGLSPQN